jgi:hypothetical protein
MIKKPTLIVLACAVILGAVVYYFDWKRGQKETLPSDKNKPAFSIQAEDVTSLTLSRPAKGNEPTIQIVKRDGAWRIVQPVETEADNAAIEGIVDGIARAHVSQTEPGGPDRLKAYGLEPPELSIQFQVKNGAKHKLWMGNEDFTSLYAYSIVDGAKDVSLLPKSLLSMSDKSLDDLRDRSVLHINRSPAHVSSFDLKNSAGEIAATKEKDEWKFTKPGPSLADSDDVDALMSSLRNAKMTAIVSEKPENLSKYGLANPSITFTVADDAGKKSTLLVGKKEGDDYFARDDSRPLVFRINSDVYKKLAEKYDDLRDKRVVHFAETDIKHIEFRNASGTMVATRKNATDWTADAPSDIKGKSAEAWKILSPLSQARAEEVLDHPSGDLLAKVAKPAIEVDLTDKDGKRFTLRISTESGDFVYALASGNPALYKLKKQVLEDLNFKPSEFAF